MSRYCVRCDLIIEGSAVVVDVVHSPSAAGYTVYAHPGCAPKLPACMTPAAQLEAALRRGRESSA